MTMRLPYTKLVGAGNDFILVDTVRHRLSSVRRRWPSIARAVCDRSQGIGADGLLVLGRSRVADVQMRIFNPDGTEPSMCGNGIRCLAWYVAARPAGPTQVSIETKDGVKEAQVLGADRVRINMGVPRLLNRIPVLAAGRRRFSNAVLIDAGVPHLVCGVDRVAGVEVEALGRQLRHQRRFAPAGVNVDFVEPVAERRGRGGPYHIALKMRTYERGVEGETRACGTGAVAATVAACLRPTPSAWVWGRQAGQFEAAVHVPGGLLRVSLGAIWVSCGAVSGRSLDSASGLARDRGERVKRVEPRPVFSSAFLEGEARQVARGTVTWNGRRA